MRPEIEAEWQGGALQSVSPHAEFDRRSGGWSVVLDDDGHDEDHGDPDDILDQIGRLTTEFGLTIEPMDEARRLRDVVCDEVLAAHSEHEYPF